MFCLVGCLQCRRCILQTPIDSKRSTHHRDAPQHSMLVTAWMNYKYTASYFQVSLSSNGIRFNPTLQVYAELEDMLARLNEDQPFVCLANCDRVMTPATVVEEAVAILGGNLRQ